MSSMVLSHADKEKVLALIAANLTAEILKRIDLDELATLELSTAGQLLGLGPKAAAAVLPVIEVGPRTRRVQVAAFKAYQAAHTKQPSRKSA